MKIFKSVVLASALATLSTIALAERQDRKCEADIKPTSCTLGPTGGGSEGGSDGGSSGESPS